MKPKNQLKSLLIISISILSLITSCTNSDNTYTISGTITKIDVADGVTAYVKLVNEADSLTTEALYAFEVTFENGKATYSESSIVLGEYTLYAFIDNNGNASGTTSSAPDGGDYVTEFNVIIDEDKIIDIQENYWVEIEIKPTTVKYIEQSKVFDFPEVMKVSNYDPVKLALNFGNNINQLRETITSSLLYYTRFVKDSSLNERNFFTGKDSIIYSWIICKEENSTNIWEFYFNYITYSRLEYFIEEDNIGSKGSYKLINYDYPLNGQYLNQIDWEFSDDQKKLTINRKGENLGKENDYIIFNSVYNADLSGETNVYHNEILIVHSIWNSNGSGEYSTYDYNNGTLHYSVSWTVENLSE